MAISEVAGPKNSQWACFFCENGQKTAENCKTPLPSYFQARYWNFGGKTPNFNEKAEIFHCMHVLVLQGLRQHSTTAPELAQRTGLFFVSALRPALLQAHSSAKPTLRTQTIVIHVWANTRNSTFTGRHAISHFNAKCVGPAHACGVNSGVNAVCRRRLTGLTTNRVGDVVALWPRNVHHSNVMIGISCRKTKASRVRAKLPCDKFTVKGNTGRKMVRMWALDPRANTVKQKGCAHHLAGRWTNTWAKLIAAVGDRLVGGRGWCCCCCP